MKNTITNMKTTLEEINSRLAYIQEYINDLEDKIMGITQSGEQVEKQIGKSESNIWELWDHMKSTNLHMIGNLEGEKEKQGF